MRFALFRKTLRDGRRGLMWWGTGFAFLGALWMGLFPSIRQSAGQMGQFVEKMPEALRAIFVGQGVIDLRTANGYLKMEAFSFMLPLLFTIFAVGAAARTIVGEEERGTLEVLLANPLSRGSVLRQKLAAIAVSTLALAVAFDVAVFGVGAAVGAGVGHVHVIEATAAATLVGIAFGMLALALGCAGVGRGASIGIGAGLAVAMYLVQTLATVVPVLAGPRRVSLLFYYVRSDPLIHGIGAVDLLVIGGFAAACAGAAMYVFPRRDLAI